MKTQQRKRRQQAALPAPAQELSPKFIGSPRSARNLKEQSRLAGQLTTCKAQVEYWERKLASAEEGVKRNTAQLSAGHGVAHSILEGYVSEVAKAKQMIASFKAHAADLQKQIDALFPDAVKAAERAQVQSIVAGQIRARLALDKTLDFRLESVRGILAERAALTSEIRKGIDALEFEYGFGLDEQRFEDLLRTLPREMAGESERFVYWFLGQEQGRTPCRIHGSDIELRETLRAANFFGPDDCPNLAKEEEAEVERIRTSRIPPSPPVEALPTRRLGDAAEEIPAGKIQWALLR